MEPSVARVSPVAFLWNPLASLGFRRKTTVQKGYQRLEWNSYACSDSKMSLLLTFLYLKIEHSAIWNGWNSRNKRANKAEQHVHIQSLSFTSINVTNINHLRGWTISIFLDMDSILCHTSSLWIYDEIKLHQVPLFEWSALFGRKLNCHEKCVIWTKGITLSSKGIRKVRRACWNEH